jgi:hypothetical protein
MTSFNLTFGVPSSTRLIGVAATKYTVAPRTNQFKATVNGVESPAWTTEGRGSHYVYFKHGDDLFYVKMAGPGELIAARQSLVVTTDAWEEAQPRNPNRITTPKAPARKRVAKAKAKA